MKRVVMKEILNLGMMDTYMGKRLEEVDAH